MANRTIGQIPTVATTAQGAKYEIEQDGTSKQMSHEVLVNTLYTYITTQATPTRVTAAAPDAIGEYRSYLRDAGARTYSETNGSPTDAPSSADGYKIYFAADYSAADASGQPSRYEIYIGTGKTPFLEFYSGTGRTGRVMVKPFQRHGGADVNGGVDWSYDPVTGIVQVFSPPYQGGAFYSGLDTTGTAITADIYFDIKC